MKSTAIAFEASCIADQGGHPTRPIYPAASDGDSHYHKDDHEQLGGLGSGQEAGAREAVEAEAWASCWKRGEPVIVMGVAERLRESWTPRGFSQEFGDVQVPLVDVRTTNQFTASLKAFFDGFGSVAARPQPPPVSIHADSKALPTATDSTPGSSSGSSIGGTAGSVAADGATAATNSSHNDHGSTSPAHLPPLLKLKDWPPSTDFSEILPRHFADLMAALPQPLYTRRDGSLNLASRLPHYMLPPDLGPKMYVAYGTLGSEAEQACLFGTTCLHMDMADAVNLMVYVQRDPPIAGGDEHPTDAETPGQSTTMPLPARPPDYGERGGERGGEHDETLRSAPATAGAIWDIWKAEDEPRLSSFLWRVAREELGEERVKQMVGHPIHDANLYVDAKLRRRLYVEEGITSYRFVQCEGESVFIPAGCPHQVLNIRSSIKVAEDFVSPEHICRCLRLTEQLRQLPITHKRKQDGLGVKDIILHALSHAVSVLGKDGSVA